MDKNKRFKEQNIKLRKILMKPIPLVTPQVLKPNRDLSRPRCFVGSKLIAVEIEEKSIFSGVLGDSDDKYRGFTLASHRKRHSIA
jgi:hypothetical protein